MKVATLLATACMALTGCSSLKPVNLLNAVIPATGYSLDSNIQYGPEPRQKLDIYHPDKPATQSRLIIFVYGGAWREGVKSQYEFVGQALSAAGHTVVIPDYRLYPDVTYPEVVTDIAVAISSLPSVADSLIVAGTSEQDGLPATSGRRIVLMGHSSGAHTAALLAADPQYLASSEFQVEALIALAGPYDLPLDNPEVATVFAEASADSVKLPRLVTTAHPPTLLAHGTDDERVDPGHTERYEEALKDSDVSVTVHWEEGTGHAALLAGLALPLRSRSDLLEAIEKFLDSLPERKEFERCTQEC